MIYVVAHGVANGPEFQAVPLAVRFLHFVLWVAIPRFVLPWALPKPVEPALALGFVLHRQPGFAHQDDVSGAAFDHLEFNGMRPDLVFAVHMKQHTTVPGFVPARFV